MLTCTGRPPRPHAAAGHTVSVRAAGAPVASIFAGVSVTAVSLGSMLLPAQHQRAVVADMPCTDTSPGAASGTPTPVSTPSEGSYELCLSVVQSPAAPATPGSDLTYAIQVWVASLGPAKSSAATEGIPAIVTLRAGRGDGKLHWSVCPGSVDQLACGPLQPGAAGSMLQADLAIPADAGAGQAINFTVNAADPNTGATNVQPAAPVTETVTVPTPSPSPSTGSPSPSSSSHRPSPRPTGSHSRRPSPSASATKSGTHSSSGTGATGGGLPGDGASLPPVAGRGGLLGNLPSPSVPAPSFPEVTPEPSAAASPVALPGPQDARMANAAAQFPLNGRMIGVQLAGLAVLAAAVTIAVARLSLRRRTPRHGK